MTNFPNPPGETSKNKVSGAGSNRYVKAANYINGTINTFGYNEGIETLKMTMQKRGSYPTQCSMLFDPKNSEVYLFLKQNYEKIWKVSIDNKTIETFSGFDTKEVINIDEEGVLISNLLKYQKRDNGSERKFSTLLSYSFFILGLYILLNTKKPNVYLRKKINRLFR